MQVSILLQTIAVLIVLMLIGYTGARKAVFSPQVTKAMSALVFNVFLVSSVFASICEDLPDMSGGALLRVMLVLGLTIGLSYLLAGLLARLLLRRSPLRATAELCMSTMNTLMFGLPIVQQVYGGSSVLYMGLSSVPFNILLYSWGVWRIHKSSGSGKSGMRLKDILTPTFIATLLGLAILVARLPIPAVLQKYLDSTAAATLPMSMIVLGATMGGGGLLDAFKDKRVYLVVFFRLIFCPLVVWLILNPMGLDAMLLRTAVVIAGCPCGAVVPVLALQYDQDALFASRCVMVSTLLSVVTLPAVIMLLG